MQRFVKRSSLAAVVILLFTGIFIKAILGAPLSVQAETDWESMPMKKNVPLNKEWTITFSGDVEVSSITNKQLYITDEAGQVIPTTAVLVDQGNTVVVQPPKGGYLPNTAYTLFVADEVSSAKRKLLRKPVKMPFQTGEQRDESNAFSPRKDSTNAVTYQEGVTSLPDDIVQSAADLNYENNTFVFDGMPDVLKQLSARDIIIFPETAQHTFGWAKEIVDIRYDGHKTVLTTREPKAEDVVKDLDISKTVPITADDFMLEPDVYSRVISETENGDRRTFEVENPVDKSIGKIEIGEENGNPYVEFSDVQLFPKGEKEGAATIGGKIQLIQPMVNYDFKGLNVNWLELDSGLKNELNVKVKLSGFEPEPLRIPLTAPIPVKAYGVAGAAIQLFIQCETSGKVFVELEIVEEKNYNLGLMKEGAGYKPFNYSTSDLSAEFLSLKGEIEGKVGGGININADVLQFTLGGIDTAGGYKMKVAGEIDKDIACFSEKGEIYFESTARIGSEKNTYWDVTYPFLSIPLVQRSTCGYQELTGDAIVLAPGETKELKVSGTDQKGNVQPLTLPDSNVTLKVKDRNIATANYLGGVRAKTTAKDGDQTFITIRYNNGRDAIVKADIPVYIASQDLRNELRKTISTIGPDIRNVLETAEIVNGAYRDFSYIENDLRKLATPQYVEEVREYYEKFMHPTIDISLFAEPVSTELKFEIIENSPSKRILKTVVPNRGLSSGANQIYTFVKEGGKWLLDGIDGESFEESPINPTVDQVQDYLQKSYYQDFGDVRTEFISSGTEKIYNQPENKYYDREYHTFHVKTVWDQYRIKFSAHDGSIMTMQDE
ncbi:hypothetical protein CSV74_07465 [Sporosarcina sp. P19]|nr:hypothetical protein CSV74_07465 [Sporosarcina sp. P19]